MTRRLAVRVGWRRAALGALVLGGPLLVLNGLVAFCGSSVVFPLSPRHLRAKATALARYAAHQPHCLAAGHAPMGPAIARAEARHRLPAGLLAALVQVESAGRAHRISPAGAMGPGQLTPSTARALGVDDPFDTVENIDGSALYLAAQLAHFRDVRLALAAYNAGPGAVAASRSVPHNGETEIYVERVLRARRASPTGPVAHTRVAEAAPAPAPPQPAPPSRAGLEGPPATRDGARPAREASRPRLSDPRRRVRRHASAKKHDKAARSASPARATTAPAKALRSEPGVALDRGVGGAPLAAPADPVDVPAVPPTGASRRERRIAGADR